MNLFYLIVESEVAILGVRYDFWSYSSLKESTGLLVAMFNVFKLTDKIATSNTTKAGSTKMSQFNSIRKAKLFSQLSTI